MQIDYEAFGQRIRLLRQEQHITQTELAKRVGLSASFLGHIERGTRIASIATLLALSEVLNVSTDYLLKGSSTDKHREFTEQQIKALLEIKRVFTEEWLDTDEEP